MWKIGTSSGLNFWRAARNGEQTKKKAPTLQGVGAEFTSDATGHDNGDEIGRYPSGAMLLNDGSTLRAVTRITKMQRSSRSYAKQSDLESAPVSA